MKNNRPSFLTKIKGIFKWIGIVLSTFILLALMVVFSARGVNAMKTKIRTDNGIQEDSYIRIGGIEQYIQIRGEDINNPIILFLHGGPGGPQAYLSYYYQRELEDDYTIVNWDQRGSGRTYYANPDLDVETDLSPKILLNDLNHLVDYITHRFGQEKVIIMGHSWGSVLGSIYVKEYPEKVSTYIGVGQAVNCLVGETVAVKRAKELAAEDKNEEYIEKLSILFNKYSTTEDYENFDFNSFMSMRGLTSQYLSCDSLASAFHSIWLGISSPNMSIKDIKWFIKPIFKLEEYLKIEKSLFDYYFFGFNIYDHGIEYEVPVYYISGDCDWITPYSVVEEYYNSIKAPDKDMMLIENAGHIPFIDNSKAFCEAVKSILE